MSFVRKHIKGDRALWAIIFILAFASILSVYSSTGFLAERVRGGNTSYYLFKQFFSLGIGIVVMIVCSNMKADLIVAASILTLYISILLLLITLFMGATLNTASRWLVVPVVGISFQPSEFAKISLIVYIANVLARYQKEDGPITKPFWNIIIHVAIVFSLIVTENLSTALLIVAVSFAMMFVGRISMKYLLVTAAVAISFVGLVILLSSHLDFIPRAKTWSSRIEQFVNPEEANPNLKYQSEQSKIAIATGGLLGKGPGNSVQRNFLPHPYSDFIFAIIAEEYGLFGALIIIFCYMSILGRVGVIMFNSKRTFPAFMSLGLGVMLVSQALLNMGVAVGLFPVTGQPLPLVSLGTSSILSSSIAFGFILSASRINKDQKALEKGETEIE